MTSIAFRYLSGFKTMSIRLMTWSRVFTPLPKRLSVKNGQVSQIDSFVFTFYCSWGKGGRGKHFTNRCSHEHGRGVRGRLHHLKVVPGQRLWVDGHIDDGNMRHKGGRVLKGLEVHGRWILHEVGRLGRGRRRERHLSAERVAGGGHGNVG